MSKGAVEKYGVNTLAAMNAAGGGTNIPTITNEYNDGGIVDRSRFYNKMGSPMVRANNTQKVNYINGGYVGESFKFNAGKNIQGNTINNFNPVQKFISGGLVNNINTNNVVQGFQGGGRVTGSRKIDGGALVNTMQVADTKPTTQVVPPPSSTTNNVVKNYNIEQAQQEAQYSGGGGGNVPKINAEKYISKQKIRTLGIMM